MLPLSNSKSIFQDFFIGSMRLQNLPSPGETTWSGQTSLTTAWKLLHLKHQLNTKQFFTIHISSIHISFHFRTSRKLLRQNSWHDRPTSHTFSVIFSSSASASTKKTCRYTELLGKVLPIFVDPFHGIFIPTKIQPFLRKICMVST